MENEEHFTIGDQAPDGKDDALPEREGDSGVAAEDSPVAPDQEGDVTGDEADVAELPETNADTGKEDGDKAPSPFAALVKKYGAKALGVLLVLYGLITAVYGMGMFFGYEGGIGTGILGILDGIVLILAAATLFIGKDHPVWAKIGARLPSIGKEGSMRGGNLAGRRNALIVEGVLALVLLVAMSSSLSSVSLVLDGHEYYSNAGIDCPSSWEWGEDDSSSSGGVKYTDDTYEVALFTESHSSNCYDFDSMSNSDFSGYVRDRAKDGTDFTPLEIDGHKAYRWTADENGRPTTYTVVGTGSRLVVLTTRAETNDVTAANTLARVNASLSVGEGSKAKVTFLDGEKNLGTGEGVDYGSGAVVKAPAVKDRDGKRLKGWKIAVGDKVSFDGKSVFGVRDGDKLVPVWVSLHTVTFTDGNGVTIDSQVVEDGCDAKAPVDPKRSGFEFKGWTGSYEKVSKDVTIDAAWVAVYTVTFTDGNGGVLNTEQVRSGESASEPKMPTRTGYNFDGWDCDFSNVTSNITVNAKWVTPPTVGERNALSRAKSYLKYTSFSYTGLIDQLKFEGYTDKEATYGADHCGADWNKQAELKAEAYMNYSSFSRSGLIGQLEFEGFTPEQAAHGADHVGL